ncbi:hypothetical protein BLFGPEAP_01092 [Candidatus Methanoperedenaceae archaeon GB50]|nr:hypothetical protein BLFGPEAP_01092 [Candidatus Methanoperedenaceae archaeon GB50]
MPAKFNPGKIVATQKVVEKIKTDPDFASFVSHSLQRHLAGDWGDLCQEDKKENEFSLKNNLRLLSAYKKANTKIWIITEADRSATTILFPEEY